MEIFKDVCIVIMNGVQKIVKVLYVLRKQVGYVVEEALKHTAPSKSKTRLIYKNHMLKFN